jgi:hypothetical protein
MMFLEVFFIIVGLFFWSCLCTSIVVILNKSYQQPDWFVVLSVISLVFVVVGFGYPKHKEVFYKLDNKTTINHIDNTIVIEQNCYKGEYMLRGYLFILQDVLSGVFWSDGVVNQKVNLDKCL